jgi:hypothetical protein
VDLNDSIELGVEACLLLATATLAAYHLRVIIIMIGNMD